MHLSKDFHLSIFMMHADLSHSRPGNRNAARVYRAYIALMHLANLKTLQVMSSSATFPAAAIAA